MKVNIRFKHQSVHKYNLSGKYRQIQRKVNNKQTYSLPKINPFQFSEVAGN